MIADSATISSESSRRTRCSRPLPDQSCHRATIFSLMLFGDSFRVSDPVTILDQPLIKLAVRIPRQLRIEINRPRTLDRGQIRAAEIDQLRRQSRAGLFDID